MVLLDVTMPVMGGVEVFREILRLKPTAKVILSSGYDESEAESRFEGRMPSAFLQKPYTAEALIEQVRAVIELSAPRGVGGVARAART